MSSSVISGEMNLEKPALGFRLGLAFIIFQRNSPSDIPGMGHPDAGRHRLDVLTKYCTAFIGCYILQNRQFPYNG